MLLVLLLLIAACSGDAVEGTSTSGGGQTTTTATAQTTSTEGSSGSSPTTTSGSAPTTEPDLSGLEGVSDQVREQLAELIRETQQVRDLPFLTPPLITVVSEDELETRVRAQLAEGAEDLPADEALYKMLGLLADGADLETLISDLYGEQVAGFYDGDTGEIVVPAREDGFSVIQQATMVHELVHALTDQHFSFNPSLESMVDNDLLDEAVAYQALVEGDATLATALWAQTLTQRELGEFIAESLDIDSSQLNAAPRFLRESLTFPYDTGLAFAQDLYLDGQWSSVNEAYATLVGLPGSSEQVITPDDYTRDLPMDVAAPDISIDGYELERTSVWGEQGFRILLNQGTGASGVARAADGWGGDTYLQWFDGEKAALLIVYQGDSQKDVDELEDALLTFATDSFPEERFAWVEQAGGSLYFIAADDRVVGERIRAAAGLD